MKAAERLADADLRPGPRPKQHQIDPVSQHIASGVDASRLCAPWTISRAAPRPADGVDASCLRALIFISNCVP